MPKLNFSMNESNFPSNKAKTWKILIVDDEISVHQMTKIIMENWVFLGRSVTLLNAYSEEDAKRIMAEEEDIALVYMDVIIEREDSGFRLVNYVRNDLKNKFIRIVLRTGQPGTLSIREIVQKYDINDYREKTQLSVDVLYTITSSCIRAYNDLKKMENQNNYLEAFFNTYPVLLRARGLPELAEKIVQTLYQQFSLDSEAGLILSRESIDGNEPELDILSWIGGKTSVKYVADLPKDIQINIVKTLVNQENRTTDSGDYIYTRCSSLIKTVLFVSSENTLEAEMRSPLFSFLANTAPLFLPGKIPPASNSEDKNYPFLS